MNGLIRRKRFEEVSELGEQKTDKLMNKWIECMLYLAVGAAEGAGEGGGV